MLSRHFIVAPIRFLPGMLFGALVAGVLASAPPAKASEPVISWDRNIKASDIQITPGPISHVVANFRVAIIDSAVVPIDLSTIVRLTVNDGPPLDHTIVVNPSGGGAWGYCRTACLGCQYPQTCSPLSVPRPPYDFCACSQFCVTSYDLAISPGDVLHFSLLTAPGAQADVYTGDDAVNYVALQSVPALEPRGVWTVVALCGLLGSLLLVRRRALGKSERQA